jgi:hypothetical protein
MTQPVNTVPLEKIRDCYVRFAQNEAFGVSPLYEALARRVATSDRLLRFISSLPTAKHQPNLLFAAVRHLCGTPRDPSVFEQWVVANEDAVRDLMLSRRTQTNEPGRCATLLPILSGLPGPLALIEVGASAGLCLLPDFYGYDYGRALLRPPSLEGIEPPVFPCRANDRHADSLRAAARHVASRAGLEPVEPL